MKLTPDAKFNDGLFDVLSIHEMNIADRLLNFPKIYTGKHILSSHFTIKRCQKLKVESEQEVQLEADGEVLGNSPFTMEIKHHAIKIRVSN
jgi:diacylglycerol kinase (ATP)